MASTGNPKPKKRRRGRPDKLTKEIHETIVGLVRAGNYLDDAAAIAGVTDNTIRNWLHRGEIETRGKYRDFFDDTKKARATANAVDLAIVAKGERGWEARAWRLERRNPHKFGRRVLEVQNPDLVSALQELKDMTNEQLLAEYAAFIAALRSIAAQGIGGAAQAAGALGAGQVIDANTIASSPSVPALPGTLPE